MLVQPEPEPELHQTQLGGPMVQHSSHSCSLHPHNNAQNQQNESQDKKMWDCNIPDVICGILDTPRKICSDIRLFSHARHVKYSNIKIL